VKENPKQEIAIVWFKRDLRFTDHAPLYYAQQQALPVLLIYCFEPSVMQYADSDIRHWRFIYQSLQEMQTKLVQVNAKLYIFHDEAISVFQKLTTAFNIKSIFSHQETGNKITYDRDIAVQQFCQQNAIEWKEYQQNGIIRKLKSRKTWEQRWKQKMQETPKLIDDHYHNYADIRRYILPADKGHRTACRNHHSQSKLPTRWRILCLEIFTEFFERTLCQLFKTHFQTSIKSQRMQSLITLHQLWQYQCAYGLSIYHATLCTG
jgi:deoxyribodipyrimidine photolyase